MYPGKEIPPFWVIVQFRVLFGRNGYRQVFPPFGTPAFQNNSAVFGLHPLAEAMRSLATYPTGLIGSFAHNPVLSLCCCNLGFKVKNIYYN